jgi:hypothetical protein
MQAQAAESSGYARLRRTIPLLFGKKNLKTGCFESLNVKQALEQTNQRLFKSFLARNMLVAMGAVGRGSARAAARNIIKGQGGVHVPRLGRSLALPRRGT